MIKITDITLCTINCDAAPTDKLMRLYELLLLTGINFIEIGAPILHILGDRIDLNKTILRVHDPLEIKKYRGFVKYICRHSGFETPEGTISEFQVNDLRELNVLSNFSECQDVRVVGMDDLMQHDYLSVFDRLKSVFIKQPEFCPQNNYFCASALAVEWILNGGDSVAASLCGIGGFAALEEVLMALRISKRHKPNLDLSVLREIKPLLEEITGTKVSDHKPVMGDKIFDVESGIHVDGIFKNGAIYEPFEPAVVGMQRKVIVGKHSGRTTIEVKLSEYGIAFPMDRIQELLKSVQNYSISIGRSISDEEFVMLANDLIKR